MNRFNYLPNHRYYENADGVIYDSNGKALRGYSIVGENVGDYDEESGKYIIPIQVCSKNLFDENILLNNPYLASVNDYEYCFNNYYGKFYSNIIFKENTRYTFKFSGKSTGGNQRLTFVYTDGTSNNIGTWSLPSEYPVTPYIATSTANKTLKYIGVNYGQSAYVMCIKKNSIQLVEGVYTADTMPEYEPGYAKTYKIYLDDPLNGVLNSTIDKSLPVIGTLKGYNNITVCTSKQPDNVLWQYYK